MIKKILLITVLLPFIAGCVSVEAGKWDRQKAETTKTWVDRMEGVRVTVTQQRNSSGGRMLNLKTTSQDNGGEFRKFILEGDDWLFIKKITMKVDGGKGRYITWDRNEIDMKIITQYSDHYDVRETAPLISTKEVEDFVRPFGDILRKAQLDGDVTYFIRVSGKEFYKDFSFSLGADDEIPTFFR